MRFKKFCENAWVDYAKDALGLPSAMSDQDVMKHLGTLNHTQQAQLTGGDIPRRYLQNVRAQAGMPELTIYKSYAQLHNELESLNDHAEEQLQQLQEIKTNMREAVEPPTKVTDQRPYEKTKIWNAPQQGVTVGAQQQPRMEMKQLEYKLYQAVEQNRKNYFEIREIWDHLGWHDKRHADNLKFTGMKGIPESVTPLGGDGAQYFPGGFEELQHKILQTSQMIGTITTHINGILNRLNKKRTITST